MANLIGKTIFSTTDSGRHPHAVIAGLLELLGRETRWTRERDTT